MAKRDPLAWENKPPRRRPLPELQVWLQYARHNEMSRRDYVLLKWEHQMDRLQEYDDAAPTDAPARDGEQVRGGAARDVLPSVPEPPGAGMVPAGVLAGEVARVAGEGLG